ncbi:MAG: ABC transporter permease subunit [Bryobacteraceae bacterium]|nr:ABC transporter permease subunit [Bryobacteraceae bacterium]
MILSIVLKEWKEFWRDRGLRLIVLGYLAVYAVSLLVSAVQFLRYEHDRVVAEKSARESWINQGEKNPHAATYFGLVTFPKRSALSILEPGALPYLGVAAYLRTGERTDFVDLPARDRSPLLSLVSLSPAVCWQLVFPFLIVLLTYSTLARDRETGMERYLLAVGSNRATLFFGKTLGAGLVLLVIYLVTYGLGGVVASVAGGFAEEDMSAWLLIGMFYLLFSAAVFFLSLAISGLASTSRQALVGGMVMWLLVAVVLPRFAADYGRNSVASPSALELSRITELDMEKGFGDRPPREARAEETLNMLFRELKVGRREDITMNLPGFEFISEAEVEAASRRGRLAQTRQILAAQTASMERGAAFSPTTAVQLLGSTLAGTAAEQRYPVTDSAELYAHRVRRILNRELAAKGKELGGAFTSNRSFWNQIDTFDPDLPEQIEAATARTRSIVTLLVWFILALLAAATSGLVVPQMGERS